jgi:hypothetical protein
MTLPEYILLATSSLFVIIAIQFMLNALRQLKPDLFPGMS